MFFLPTKVCACNKLSLLSACEGVFQCFSLVCFVSWHRRSFTFCFWSCAMGFTSCSYVEIKAFELLVKEGTSVLRFVERSKGSPERCFWANSVWLLATVEAMVNGESLKEFVRSSRVGSKAYIAQRYSNSHGWYLALAKYGVVVGREASSSFQRVEREEGGAIVLSS